MSSNAGCSVVRSSQAAKDSGDRMTGMRSSKARIVSFAAVVTIVHDSTGEPDLPAPRRRTVVRRPSHSCEPACRERSAPVRAGSRLTWVRTHDSRITTIRGPLTALPDGASVSLSCDGATGASVACSDIGAAPEPRAGCSETDGCDRRHCRESGRVTNSGLLLGEAQGQFAAQHV
jgi:hypothetical protein